MIELNADELRKQYMAGVPVYRIASNFGCCQATVTRIAKKLGLSRHRISKVRDIAGQRFQRLVAISFVRLDKFGKALWLTRCDCGRSKVLNASAMVAGLTRSCGCLKSDRLRQGVGDLSQAYWHKLEKSANQRSFEFSITKEQAYALFQSQSGLCALSGVPIVLHPNNDKYHKQTASLDRVDSSGGYVLGNVQWVHKRVNFLKRDYDEEELVFWCTRIAETKRAIYSDITGCIPKETRGLNESVESRDAGPGVHPV